MWGEPDDRLSDRHDRQLYMLCYSQYSVYRKCSMPLLRSEIVNLSVTVTLASCCLLVMLRAEAYGSSFVCLSVCHSVCDISFAAHVES